MEDIYKILGHLVHCRKGFINHPDTPEEDKAFYLCQKKKSRLLLEIGERFLAEDGVSTVYGIARGKEELCKGAKFLRRGFYCPSPLLDILISNSCRGKILVRPSKRSKITNRYVFDTSDRLIYVDNHNVQNGKKYATEYLLYEGNTVYGIEVALDGSLLCVTEAYSEDNRIKSVAWAEYSGKSPNTYCYEMHCERYHYDERGLTEWDYYDLNFGVEKIAPSGFIEHRRYRFTHEDGWLKSFTEVNIDGTPMDHCGIQEIKIKRKV